MQTEASFEEAMNRKYPEQVAIAVARDAGRDRQNPIALGWVMQTSIDPPMLAFSVGGARYSLEVIRDARQFVVSFPSESMKTDALFFGSHTGRDVDKLAERGTRTAPAMRVDGVLFTDAVANFECELESEHVTGDHVILVGRVVASHVNDNPGVRRIYTVGEDFQLAAVEPSIGSTPGPAR